LIYKPLFLIFTGLFCLFYLSFVNATTGYFALGYGPKSNGMAGATVAASQDAMAGAINPAGMALVGKRIDLSLRAFNPQRDASLDSRVVGGRFKIEDKSDMTWFFIPGAGLTVPITEDLWFGLTLYGNGGMNTAYSRNLYDETAAVLGAFAQAGGRASGAGAAASVPKGTGTGAKDTGRLGVDLAQAILAPTLAFKIHPKHSIGISALLAIQSFEAKGLGNFQCFTLSAAADNPAACSPGGFGPVTPGFKGSKYLTDNGRDWAYGAGVRVGWVGEILPQVTLGGAFSSKIYMTKFGDYKELFAEDGRFDIPSQFQVGIALRPVESLLVTFDYQRILYSDVKSIGNKGPVASPFGPSIPNGSGLLGRGNGLGFGWEDINIYRFGTAYNFNKHLTFRAGYSWNDSPIPNNQLLFNIIAPAAITRHITAGITYSPDKNNEWHLTYTHALHEGQNQSNSAFGVPVSISMHQNAIEIGYSWKY
jgi:long-chain fatty acid transport protein